jgi:hypothetical protein
MNTGSMLSKRPASASVTLQNVPGARNPVVWLEQQAIIRLLLECRDATGRTGLTENRIQKQRHPPLALPEAAHKQRHQSHPSGSAVVGRYTRRQRAQVLV